VMPISFCTCFHSPHHHSSSPSSCSLASSHIAHRYHNDLLITLSMVKYVGLLMAVRHGYHV
jgi:hypothetical protein